MKKICLLLIICLTFLLSISLINPKLNAATARIEEELPIVYQQGDYRWNYHVHGGGTIGSSACGLLSVTNAVNYLNGNFIHPLELADYAYSIQAYNTPEGGGTWRYIFYRQLECFENKYGFKVTNPGTEKPLNDACKEHLKKGDGAIIALVPGHFIALVEYDEATNSFLVYDSAASVSKRHTYQRGTWLTEAELSGDIEAMKIQWHCLIRNNVVRDTHLDGFDNDTNGRASATFTLSYNNRANNLPISGYACDSREIINYYYTLDYQTTKYQLSPYEREENIKEGLSYNPNMLGFKGSIDTSNLSVGTHYAYVCGETKNGGVCTIAEIEIRIDQDEPIDINNKTFTVSMSSAYNQPDIIKNNNNYNFTANYGTVIDLGKIDLTNFKSARIYYQTSSNFDSNESGIQSIIGLKKTKSYFGYYGTNIDLNSSIAYANMEDGNISGSGTYATLDLSNCNYNGHVYLNGYNQQSQYYYVSKVVFYYNDNYDIELNHSETKKELSNIPYYLGEYNLLKQPYVLLDIDNELLYDKEVCITATDENNQVLGYLNFQKIINFLYGINYKTLILNINSTSKIYLTSNIDIAFNDIKMCDDNSVPLYSLYDFANDKENYHYVLIGFENPKTPAYTGYLHTIYDSSVSPDCLNSGYNKRECLYCKEILSDEIVAPLGHDFGDLQNDKQHYQMCNRCMIYDNYEDHTFTVNHDNKYHYQECQCGYTVDYELHTYEIKNYNSVCSVCGFYCPHEKKREGIGTEATCQTEGLTASITCKSCGLVLEEAEVIGIQDHYYEDDICIWCGKEKSNQEKLEEEIINKFSCHKTEVSSTILLFINSLIIIGIFKKKH